MTKYTPGPWELNEHDGTVYIEGRGSTVAVCHDEGFGIDQPTAEANANLIAAAPDLYEIMERMTYEIANLGGVCADTYTEALRTMRKAKEAEE